jgi:hypothetical protein
MEGKDSKNLLGILIVLRDASPQVESWDEWSRLSKNIPFAQVAAVLAFDKGDAKT